MSIDTVTLNLDPSDATITSYWDNVLGQQYAITVEKGKAPFFALFLLEGLNPTDQANIPSHIKERIVRGTGLKYVFRLADVARTALFCTSAGIAAKAFADGPMPQYLAEKAPKLLMKGIEAINLHPYITASALATFAGASTLVSQEVAKGVSDVLEGIYSVAKKVTFSTIACIKTVGKYCYENPGKVGALSGGFGLGVLSYYKVPTIQNALNSVYQGGSNWIAKLLK